MELAFGSIPNPEVDPKLLPHIPKLVTADQTMTKLIEAHIKVFSVIAHNLESD
jgi:hypothetical protein